MDKAQASARDGASARAANDGADEAAREQPQDGRVQDNAADAAARRMARAGLDGTQRALATSKAVELAARGARDVNQVTDEVFFVVHPERDPHQKLSPGSAEAQQWMELREDVVRPQVTAFANLPTAEEHATEAITPIHDPAPLDPHQKQAATRPDEARVLNQVRASTHRFDPKWMLAAQAKLNVADASGALNTETLRALRNLVGDQKLGADKLLDAAFLNQHVLEGAPFLHAEEGFAHQAPDQGATTNADRAAQAVGYANYAAYRGAFQDVKLLGVSPRKGSQAHPYLIARLQAAESFLRARHPGKTDAQIVQAIGWNGGLVASYGDDDKSVKDGMAHMHTMGLAVDIDPAVNPYIFDQSGYAQSAGADGAKWFYDWYHQIFKDAAQVYGGEAIDEKKMVEWSNTMSTEELHARIAQASQSFEKYMALGEKDRETIVATLKGAGFNDAEAQEKADALKGHSGSHKKSIAEIFHSGHGQEKAKGLTTISQDMLIALRDVAGLAWGGTEMSTIENGDFMHFDCRNDSFGQAIFGARHAKK